MKTITKTLGMAVAMLFAGAAGAVYKCVDDKGFTRIGDTPPEQCANVVMYEVSTTGLVLRKIDPSLTPEQAKARAEEAARRKEADKVANEARRKDLALLATFSSEGEFDTVRDRTIEPINGRIKSARDRIAAIEKRQKEIDEEMEFYKAGKSKVKARDGKEKAAPEAPPMLVGEMQRLKNERENLTRGMASGDRDIAALRAKFEVDKKRWIALKSGTAGNAAAEPPPVAEARQDTKAAARPDPKAVKKTY